MSGVPPCVVHRIWPNQRPCRFEYFAHTNEASLSRGRRYADSGTGQLSYCCHVQIAALSADPHRPLRQHWKRNQSCCTFDDPARTRDAAVLALSTCWLFALRLTSLASSCNARAQVIGHLSVS